MYILIVRAVEKCNWRVAFKRPPFLFQKSVDSDGIIEPESTQ
jgi:hypothetical protein